jgi:hypothetical protein
VIGKFEENARRAADLVASLAAGVTTHVAP